MEKDKQLTPQQLTRQISTVFTPKGDPINRYYQIEVATERSSCYQSKVNTEEEDKDNDDVFLYLYLEIIVAIE